MRKKKIAVLGRGTAGSLAISHFARWMPDCELEWHFDPNTPTQSVGEGSQLNLPISLIENVDFSYYDLQKINGTLKTGILKEGWGKDGKTFFHDFPAPSVSLHFSAVELQKYIFDKLKSKVKIIEHNITSEEIDADHIMDCSGQPKSFDDFDISNYIPVNSVHVVQCPWDRPQFDYTLTIARPYGWVFGIPLTNRCSIGYLYNNKINTLEEVEEDIKYIFNKFNLTPSEQTNTFTFMSYRRKQNFSERIIYNGNNSFFYEPLEATSIGVMDRIQRSAIQLWRDNYVDVNHINNGFMDFTDEIESFIMLHYFSGSPFKTNFWDQAEERGVKCIQKLKHNVNFKNICVESTTITGYGKCKFGKNLVYGGYGVGSFYQNLRGFGIEKRLIDFLEK